MKIIRIGAVWCPNCIFMKSVWEDVSKELGNLKMEYIDMDDDEELAKKYSIKDIPLAILVDEKENEIIVLKGVQEKERLVRLIKENLDR